MTPAHRLRTSTSAGSDEGLHRRGPEDRRLQLADGFLRDPGHLHHVFAPLARARSSKAAWCSARSTARRSTSHRQGRGLEPTSAGHPGAELVRSEKALKTYNVTVKDGEVCVSSPEDARDARP